MLLASFQQQTMHTDMCHEVDLENIPHIAWPLITALSANISATAG